MASRPSAVRQSLDVLDALGKVDGNVLGKWHRI